MQDLESSLSVMLRSEIAHMAIIQGDALAVLKNWIGLLTMYFPGREPVRNYLRHVNQRLFPIHVLSNQQWTQIVNENHVFVNIKP
jgi:hypothetical protein